VFFLVPQENLRLPACFVDAYRGGVIQTANQVSPVPTRCLRCPHHVPAICDVPTAQGCTGRVLCSVESPTDEELIGRHQAQREHGRPPSAFGLLFERHHRHVVAWTCRLSGNYELALDLAQEVWVKVFTRLDAFRGESRFSTWLYAVTRNCFRDYIKALAARPREVGGSALSTVDPITENDAVPRLEAQSARKLVGRLIEDARLDETERRAFAMHYGDDMPLAAITVALGLGNVSGAKAPIVSARRKLRAAAERWVRRQQARSRLALRARLSDRADLEANLA
jgi:RNA polymerase sigma factor (sigma-70 family)